MDGRQPTKKEIRVTPFWSGLRVVGKADGNCTAPRLICGAFLFGESWEGLSHQAIAAKFLAASRVLKTAPGAEKQCSFLQDEVGDKVSDKVGDAVQLRSSKYEVRMT